MFNMAVVRYLGFDRKRVLTSLRLTETDNLSAVIFQHNGLMRDVKEKNRTKTHSIHIAHYTHNHLNLCHKHFVIASKITIFRIKASLRFCIRSLGSLELKKEQQSFIMSLLFVFLLFVILLTNKSICIVNDDALTWLAYVLQ